MDWLVLLGVFISGLGIGLSVVGQRKDSSDQRPCSCECHCSSPTVERESPGLFSTRDIIALVILVVLVGVIYLALLHLPGQSKPIPWGKGKGKRGIFGGGAPLSLRDGGDVSR